MRIPDNVHPEPANPKGEDRVFTRYDERHGGFLGFEVVWADHRKTPSWYSDLSTLPEPFRSRAFRVGKYCSEKGCTNAIERGSRCRTHRKTRKSKTARSAAGQRG